MMSVDRLPALARRTVRLLAKASILGAAMYAGFLVGTVMWPTVGSAVAIQWILGGTP